MKQENDFSNSIYIVGAGGIVANAHLPAYQIANYTVTGITDVDVSKATEVAAQFNIANVYHTIEDMVKHALPNAVYDIAVPANQITNIINLLPNDSFVLIQKPLGEDYEQAKTITKLCKQKNIIAAVNFQLRYAPFIIEAKNLLPQLGSINAIEVHVDVYTPWHLWSFLENINRVEILYHSIHYIDVIKSFLGMPKSIFAKTTKHKEMKNIASVKSNIIFDYDEYLQATIHTNHCNKYGIEKQQSYIKFVCDNGAIIINFGALINYPRGVADSMECINTNDNKGWQKVALQGTWFPHAFIGSMKELLMAANDNNYTPDNHIDSALQTMACVEAAYLSNHKGGVYLNEINND